MAHDLRKVLRLLADKHYQPSAVILDGRTLQSTPESGKRAGYDGYKRKKGSKVHAAVDTVFETSYIIQLNQYLSIQPDIQYIVRPSGYGDIPNALVIGVQATVSF